MTDHRLDRRDLLKAAGTGMLAVGASQSPLVGEGGVARATDVEVTEITDWHDLAAVRDRLDGEYVLVADLDSDTDGYDEHVATPEGGASSRLVTLISSRMSGSRARSMGTATRLPTSLSTAPVRPLSGCSV